MKLYEQMNQGENLSWCKPLSNKEGTRVVVVNDGVVIRSLFTVSTPKEFREQGNDIYANQDKPDYLIEKYGLHYELGCSECPFRDECDAMIIRE